MTRMTSRCWSLKFPPPEAGAGREVELEEVVQFMFLSRDLSRDLSDLQCTMTASHSHPARDLFTTKFDPSDLSDLSDLRPPEEAREG